MEETGKSLDDFKEKLLNENKIPKKNKNNFINIIYSYNITYINYYLHYYLFHYK